MAHGPAKMTLSSNAQNVLAATVYEEARGEPKKGQTAVVHVIRNRVNANREYWGGGTVEGVCLKEGQFECWNGRDVGGTINQIKNTDDFREIHCHVGNAWRMSDITQGSDHYNNPDKEGYPSWTKNCTKTMKIGNHQFYRSNC
ncbi:unnamed protein product [Cyprideis torosa]|uniref:Uncharacterized protein n=1 Tax=Cyprideis torosa TaxID=163714 RepID=A0A7R8WJT7_9CRUS|nr:unnamed protein product [Cyprideis torosa]CAG0895354.1 unnamed protein product [Cyprideis torosa]